MHALSSTNINNHLINDKVFNKMSKLFISLHSDDEIKQQTSHLIEIFNELIELMRSKSPLFDKTYNRTVWAGSFYKKTKIESPDEYDLNLIIKLPFNERDIKFSTTQPGYIKIPVNKNNLQSTLDKNSKEYREIMSFIDDEYLNQDKFRGWIEGILFMAAYATSKNNKIRLKHCTITVKKSGPAFTLWLQILGNTISIDLVPVLAFSSHNLPINYTTNYTQKFHKRYWFAVPKPLRKILNAEERYYWRMCFYEYEKDILSSYGQMKPIIRHLKKFRDTQGWKNIASYYIETLCYHHLDIFANSKIKSFTFLFFTMLEKLHGAFSNYRIEYYWDKRLNLLENIGRDEINNMQGRLFRIIENIKKHIANDPFVIAKYVLNTEELNHLYKCSGVILEASEIEQTSINQWSCVIV